MPLNLTAREIELELSMQDALAHLRRAGVTVDWADVAAIRQRVADVRRDPAAYGPPPTLWERLRCL